MIIEKKKRTRKEGKKENKLLGIQIQYAQRKKETEKKEGERERQRRQWIGRSDKCAGTVSASVPDWKKETNRER